MRAKGREYSTRFEAAAISIAMLTACGPVVFTLDAGADGGAERDAASDAGDATPSTFALTIALGGSGHGTVETSNGDRSCVTTCRLDFVSGASVSLIAQPDALSRFDGWAGDCEGTGPCDLVMNQSRAVTAVFTDISHIVTVAKSGLGEGSITSTPLGISCGDTCSARFIDGDRVELIATPSASSRFDGWSGACTGRAATCSFTLESAATATATFHRNIVRQVALGLEHTCAILDPGIVRCWGKGADGQLGYGDTQDRGNGIGPPANAGDVPLGATVSKIALGNWHTCALLTTGKVRCWGRNTDGQLGYGDRMNRGNTARTLPTDDVPLGEVEVVHIGAGAFHTCAQMNTGAVRCWGAGQFGQLGYGSTENRLTGDLDVPLAGSVRVEQLAVGAIHTCVLLDTGRVRCWGHGGFGEHGYGDNLDRGNSPSNTPVMDNVPLGDIAIGSLVAGVNDTCALWGNGNLRCWGQNLHGQLGRDDVEHLGDDVNDDLAVDVPVNALLSQATAGSHICAISSTGDLRCWGHNNDGELGLGDTMNRGDGIGPTIAMSSVPITVTPRAVAVGSGPHTCAITESFGLRCWGLGASGQLGYGDRSNYGDGIGPAAGATDVPVF